MVSQKLYCYVDETGQDTLGKIFVVSVIVAKEDREEITQTLEKTHIACARGGNNLVITNTRQY